MPRYCYNIYVYIVIGLINNFEFVIFFKQHDRSYWSAYSIVVFRYLNICYYKLLFTDYFGADYLQLSNSNLWEVSCKFRSIFKLSIKTCRYSGIESIFKLSIKTCGYTWNRKEKPRLCRCCNMNVIMDE